MKSIRACFGSDFLSCCVVISKMVYCFVTKQARKITRKTFSGRFPSQIHHADLESTNAAHAKTKRSTVRCFYFFQLLDH